MDWSKEIEVKEEKIVQVLEKHLLDKDKIINVYTWEKEPRFFEKDQKIKHLEKDLSDSEKRCRELC